ncbi:hypothetical protein [Pseudomonas sp. SK2]|uniref:hypothetical protein n=1 Tax=Pseudomonas sp. SK2 TaxID=2841063 RepID=UPI00192B1A26|nr:hypothetical protein [Pseudomonas sp. SK2]QQZ37673.1 hypothetical protein IF103_06990 [Pseudomonas sp. SK2]
MNEQLDKDEALEAPAIEGLTAFGEIDLDELGNKPLKTLIKYTGMKIDDLVRVRWLGRSVAGEAYDFAADYPVQDEHLDDGLQIEIANGYIANAAGGEAFYSYTRLADGPVPDAESLRTFCYIGVRPRGQVETPSVLHAIHSHGLIIQPDKLPGAGMTVVVPRYQSMQEGDKVTLTVECYEPDGTRDDTWKKVVTVGKTHLDQNTISDGVPRSYFDWIDPGYVLAYYEIEFAVGGRLKSPVQRLEVESRSGSLPGYLDKPAIEGHSEGDPLDPNKYPDGLLIKLPKYPGIADSDHLILIWSIPGGAQYLPSRVDPSTRAADSIVFQISPELLAISRGSTVNVSYLYGREGAALSSQVLQVDVQLVRSLGGPRVEGADQDGAGDRGHILADSANPGGVYINVPAGIVLPDEVLHVHWSGYGPLGEYVAEAPFSAEKPLRFHIPAKYVPANMGRTPVDTSFRFDVFYRLSKAPGDYIDSLPYKLRIKPLDSGLPTVDLPPGPVSLGAMPEAGVKLSMGTWPFIAPGQLLTIVMEGVSGQNAPVEVIVRDQQAVTESESLRGVSVMLAKSEFRKLQVGESFTLYGRVSFNGGEFYLKCPSQSSKLNP